MTGGFIYNTTAKILSDIIIPYFGAKANFHNNYSPTTPHLHKAVSNKDIIWVSVFHTYTFFMFNSIHQFKTALP